MARVHFSEGVKQPPPAPSSDEEEKYDRILEANARTRRHLHRSRQDQKRRARHQQREMSGEMDGGPLSGVVRYLARRMERSRDDIHTAAVGGHKRRRTMSSAAARVAVAAVALATILLTTFQSPGTYSSATSLWRRMQEVREEIKSCVPKAEPKTVRPILTASYPGSGAKLTWKLLRAITGIMTGDDHDHNGLVGKGQVVSIKTHYPAIQNEVGDELWEGIKDVPRVMILLRHPMNALPSYHNFEYEQRNNLPNHSTRAPVEAWVEWRDERFAVELEAWERLVRHYMGHYGLKERYIALFERVSSKDQDVGVEEMRHIGAFLKEGDERIDVIDEGDLPCVWETVVADKRVGFEGKRRHSLRKGGAVKYPFKPEQLDEMEKMLRGLADYGQLKPHMEYYIEMLNEERRQMAMPKDAEEKGEVK